VAASSPSSRSATPGRWCCSTWAGTGGGVRPPNSASDRSSTWTTRWDRRSLPWWIGSTAPRHRRGGRSSALPASSPSRLRSPEIRAAGGGRQQRRDRAGWHARRDSLRTGWTPCLPGCAGGIPSPTDPEGLGTFLERREDKQPGPPRPGTTRCLDRTHSATSGLRASRHGLGRPGRGHTSGHRNRRKAVDVDGPKYSRSWVRKRQHRQTPTDTPGRSRGRSNPATPTDDGRCPAHAGIGHRCPEPTPSVRCRQPTSAAIRTPPGTEDPFVATIRQ
jgi:hypothetical protein